MGFPWFFNGDLSHVFKWGYPKIEGLQGKIPSFEMDDGYRGTPIYGNPEI